MLIVTPLLDSHTTTSRYHSCMSHSDELPSANALSALQHHLPGTLSLSLFGTVTRSHYLNLDLKHIYSPPSMLLNCLVCQCLWSHGNMALYKFCIIIIIIITSYSLPHFTKSYNIGVQSSHYRQITAPRCLAIKQLFVDKTLTKYSRSSFTNSQNERSEQL